jgi:hypothetical protein
MNLKQDFLAALNSHMDHQALLGLVQRHQAQGMTPDDAYDILQQIWLDFGFAGSDEESPLRNDLEYVMEKVWYQGGFSRPRQSSPK